MIKQVIGNLSTVALAQAQDELVRAYKYLNNAHHLIRGQQMPKQAEIRKGIKDILTRYDNFVDGYDADGEVLDIDEALKEILSYLHSQGVVIGVDRELPDISIELGGVKVELDVSDLFTGYVVVEPLIE